VSHTPTDIRNTALSHIRSNNSEGAESLLLGYLATNRDDHIALSLLGHSLVKQRKLDEAISVFREIVELRPDYADAHGNLGLALLQQQRDAESIVAFKRAVEIDSEYHDAWHALGNQLIRAGDRAAGVQCLIKAEQTDPFAPQMAKVATAMSAKDFALAERHCRQVLQRNGHHPGAVAIMAQLASQQNAWNAAEKMLQQALKHSPYNLGLWHKLADVSSQLGKHEQRLQAALRCVELLPGKANLESMLGSSYAHSGQYQQGLDAYDRAAKLAPTDANIQIQRGHILKTLGRRAEAMAAFRKSLELKKSNGVAYWALADFKDFQFDEDDMVDMAQIVDDESASPEHRSQAGFALGNALESRGDYEQAFTRYCMANQLRPNVNFDGDAFKATSGEAREIFSKSFIDSFTPLPMASPRPIFIVGLPRSGSTLVEQILASHSLIEGTMELPNLPRVMEKLNKDSLGSGQTLAQFLTAMTAEQRAAYGNKYLADTAIFRSGKPYFIDKLPPNFRLVGFIHLLLPQAIIIDARRHPLDTGLSLYKQHFAAGHDFSYSLEDIGLYYSEYLAMMDHWDEVLPGKVFCQQYSDLVYDTESSVSKLLNHCGVEFEQQCLEFHSNTRAVHTASSEQVRKPIYTSGLNSWMKFEPWLSPLASTLGKQTLSRSYGQSRNA
jgi:tetratricopeptide (TPR) repeat protein